MVTYEIRVGGELPMGLIEEFGAVGALQPAGTTLEVDIVDEAGLWGLIDTLRANGIDLLEVRRHGPSPPGTLAGQEPE